MSSFHNERAERNGRDGYRKEERAYKARYLRQKARDEQDDVLLDSIEIVLPEPKTFHVWGRGTRMASGR